MVVIGKLLGPEAVVPYTCTARLVSGSEQHSADGAGHVQQPAGRAAHERLEQGARHRGVQRAGAAHALPERRRLLWPAGHQRGFRPVLGGRAAVRWAGADAAVPDEHAAAPLLPVGESCLFCFGYERRLALTAIITDGVVTFLFLWLGVSLFGLVGAVLAPVLGICTVSLPMNVSLLVGTLGARCDSGASRAVGGAVRDGARAVAGDCRAEATRPSGVDAGGRARGRAYLLVVGPLLFQQSGRYVRPPRRGTPGPVERRALGPARLGLSPLLPSLRQQRVQRVHGALALMLGHGPGSGAGHGGPRR